jgi:hypothetical protein
LALSDYSRLQTLSVFARDVLFFVVGLQKITKLWRLVASWGALKKTDNENFSGNLFYLFFHVSVFTGVWKRE